MMLSAIALERTWANRRSKDGRIILALGVGREFAQTKVKFPV
jgi:hypothetical protein